MASWLFFRVARSLRINLDMLVVRALKNSQLTGGESHVIYGTGHKEAHLPLIIRDSPDTMSRVCTSFAGRDRALEAVETSALRGTPAGG